MGCVTIEPAGTDIDVVVFVAAQQLLDCFEEQLALTVGGSVCRSCVYPGISVPMDYCGDGVECGSNGHGMAAVRVAQIMPVTDASRGNCVFQGRVQVTYELTAFRCAATIQHVNGKPVLPSCEELASDSAIVIDDAAAMRRAIRCCFMGLNTPPDMAYKPQVQSVGPWGPRGPTGGCVGGSMQFTVLMQDCAC